MANTNSLRPILDRNPLRSDGANYSDWLRNLRNALKRERKKYVLTTPLPEGEDIKKAGSSNILTIFEGREGQGQAQAKAQEEQQGQGRGRGPAQGRRDSPC